METARSPSDFIYQQKEDLGSQHAEPFASGVPQSMKNKLSCSEGQSFGTALGTEQETQFYEYDNSPQYRLNNASQVQISRGTTLYWPASPLSPTTSQPKQQLFADYRSSLQDPWHSPPYVLPPMSYHASPHRPEATLDYQMDCDGQPSGNQPTSYAPGNSHSSIASVVSIASKDSNQIPQVYTAVGRIHELCLRATSTYLSALDANRRARESCSPRPPAPSAPRDDNNPDPDPNGNTGNTGRHTEAPCRQRDDTTNGRFPTPSTSLLKNISIICNQLWTGSQRERLEVLNVEREAAKTMMLLLEWAETVVLGDYDEWALAGEDAFWKVVHAGRHLCDWLGVQESIDAMNELKMQLFGEVGGAREEENASTE